MNESGMAQEHWFDVMSKAAVHATTRRGVARPAAVLLPSLLFGREAGIAADKKKRGKKKGGAGKGSKQKSGKKGNGTQGSPDQGNGAEHPDLMGPPEPVVDDCVDFSPDWPESPELVREWQNNCREQREQCPDDFCLYIHDWDAPDDSAAVQCCASPKTCCPDGCFDTRNDRNHCGPSCNPCPPGQECINGTCFNPCVGQPDPWTQYCPDVRFGSPCIPAAALCCGTYWCLDVQEIECCNDGRSCRRANETCDGAPSSP